MSESDDIIEMSMPANDDPGLECLIGKHVRIVNGAAFGSRTLIADPDGPYAIRARAPAAGQPDRLKFTLHKCC
jgi:hypothetical protein